MRAGPGLERGSRDAEDSRKREQTENDHAACGGEPINLEMVKVGLADAYRDGQPKGICISNSASLSKEEIEELRESGII
jgi:endonuclease YncB( thermonuclease family)